MRKNNFLTKFKKVKVKDFISFFLFFIAIIPSIILKIQRKNLWLICESENEARDNGYWLFKYIKENHPEQDVAYAINKKSVDYKKVHNLGKTIQYGSLMHWIYYLAAKKNISTQKGGKPNAAVCYFLEVYEILKNDRVFLQHGITINNQPWLYYSETKINLFICGSKPEYDFIKSKFEYPSSCVKYLGFCRFDELHDYKRNIKRILIMPTWREWLTLESKKEKVIGSQYFQKWNALINDKKLEILVNQYDVEFIFYPHREMQKYLNYFKRKEENKKIIIADWKKWDIQELLKSSSLMITDYSSVFFDFVYMKKPVLFYQFDVNEFREKQYQEGYFNYENNPFGESISDIKYLIKKIEESICNKFKIDNKFSEEHKKTFPLYDKNNCERNYYSIKNNKIVLKKTNKRT